MTAGSGSRTHILTVRPKTTFNSITNREAFLLNDINIAVTGSNSVFWELVLGANFSVAPTFADVNATYSGFESGTGGTFSNLTGGIVIASGYVSASVSAKAGIAAKVSQRYPITLNRAGAVRSLGTLSLLVTGVGGVSATRASFNFSEIR